jgi:[acyl-carrier-protein] S-malonyltransferase
MHDACQEQPSGMLTIVSLEEQRVDHLCRECKDRLPMGDEICIANYLFPKGYVISGTKEALKLMRELVSDLKDVRCSVKDVRVSGAFHSRLLNSAVDKLREGLEKAEISAPRIPVYANVTGLPYSGVEEIRQRLAEQVVKPVLWEATIRNMLERGREEGEDEREVQFVEVGPGKQLRSMLKRIDSEASKKCINVG